MKELLRKEWDLDETMEDLEYEIKNYLCQMLRHHQIDDPFLEEMVFQY